MQSLCHRGERLILNLLLLPRAARQYLTLETELQVFMDALVIEQQEERKV